MLETGDASHGWGAHAPYNVMALTGSVPVIPKTFREQLAIGGRLFAVVGDVPNMEAILMTRLGNDQWQAEKLFETVLPRLPGINELDTFTF